MARVKTGPDELDPPRIDSDKVIAFFEQRARKIAAVGPLRAVIYQDRHPDLAERRDRAEKQKILPLLGLDGSQRILDVGCGTGRWTEILSDRVAAYHGIDISPGLVTYALERFGGSEHCRFSVQSATEVSLGSLQEEQPFDVILCSGVLIYLNDEQVVEALDGFSNVAAPRARLLIREPVGVGNRLTLQDHFSDELCQTYHAIYRTEDELVAMALARLTGRGFALVATGDVFDDPSLTNRTDTTQRWLLMERVP